MDTSGELFTRSREGYFGVYFPSCEATRKIYTKMALEWAHKEFITRVQTLFHFLHDDVTNTLRDTSIVARAREKRYLTRQISILITVIFTIGCVRKTGQWSGHITGQLWCEMSW